jgi:serine/threonine-protein kinase RsbW
MTANGHHIVRLEFTSAFEMLDFVQVVSDHLARSVGLDEDSLHWIGVAIRESVINAIKHGNRNDASKRVFVEFETTTGAAGAEVPELAIRVRDQGDGFDPETLANPLDPENLLKSSGRGIFLIRNFMDDVQLQRAPEGGMEIRMVKRVQPTGATDGSVQA